MTPGLPGTAEPAEPLSEDEMMAPKKAPLADVDANIGGTSKMPLHDHASEMLAAVDDATSDGLSWLMKLCGAGAIVAICFGFLRAHSR